MKYGRETLSVDDVITTVKCKELELTSENKDNEGNGAFFAKGKKHFKKNQPHYKNHNHQNNLVDKGKLKFVFCHKEGRFKRNCPIRRKYIEKKRGKEPTMENASIGEDNFENSKSVCHHIN